jgi:hypothetical protein
MAEEVQKRDEKSVKNNILLLQGPFKTGPVGLSWYA